MYHHFYCLLPALLLTIGMTAVPQTLSADHPSGLRRPNMVYHHASTAAEGYLRGLADLTSAEGEAATNRAYAAYVAELARAQAIDNRQAAVTGYWNLRELNRQQRFGTSKARSVTLPVKTLPQRPTPEQFDADFLVVHWPAALRSEEFATERAAFERALAWRTRYNYGPGSDAHATAKWASERMLATLRGQINKLPPMEYIACRRFVESLGWETRFAP